VVIDLIEHRHAEIKTKIAELRRLERDLAAVRARATTLNPRDCDPSGICPLALNSGKHFPREALPEPFEAASS
jgi:hypothetical protein